MKLKIFFFGLINILLNNYFYHFFILLLFLKGDFIIISEITFLLAPLFFFKESFSSNYRTLLLSDKKINFYKVFIKQRILYAILILIIYFFFVKYFFKSEDILFLILIVISIKFMWINELNITSYEIISNIKKIIRNLIFLIIFYFYFTYYIFFPSENFLYIPIIILVYLSIKYFYKHKINLFSIFKNLKIKKKIDYKLLSTISINLSNLTWRIFFFILLEKEFSGILFSIYALMSFPSSVYSNTIGMSVETQNLKKNLFKGILIIYYFCILILLYHIFVSKINLLDNLTLSKFFFTTVLFSFLGSLIMIFSISNRIKILNYKKSKRNTLFQVDILYAIMNVLSLMIVYFLIGSYFFSVLFFISSIFSLSYYLCYKKLK